MKFMGVGWSVQGTGKVDEILKLGERAEAMGLAFLGVPGSMGVRPGMGGGLDPLTLVTALAMRTRSIKIGTKVLPAPQYHPIDLAKRLATIDLLSGGRVIFGAGIGGTERRNGRYWDYTNLGLDPRERGARADEMLPLMKRLWTEDDVSHEGRFWKFEQGTLKQKPIQRPIPIWIGGSSTAAVQRAIRVGEGWMGTSEPTSLEFEPDTFPGYGDRIARAKQMAREGGRDPESIAFSVCLRVNVNPNASAAIEEARHHYENVIHRQAEGGLAFSDKVRVMGATCYGPPELLVEEIQRVRAAGGHLVPLHLHSYNLAEQMERIEKYVLPKVA